MGQKNYRSRRLVVWLMLWTFMVVGAFSAKAESNHLDENGYMSVSYNKEEGKVILKYDLCRVRTQSSTTLPSYITELKIYVDGVYCYLINNVQQGDKTNPRKFYVTNVKRDSAQYGKWTTQHKDGWSDWNIKKYQTLQVNSYEKEVGWRSETHWYIPQSMIGKTVTIKYEYRYKYGYKDGIYEKHEFIPKEGYKYKEFQVTLSSPVNSISLNHSNIEDLGKNRLNLQWTVASFNNSREKDGKGKLIVQKKREGTNKWTEVQSDAGYGDERGSGTIPVELNKFSAADLNDGFRLRVVREREPYQAHMGMPIFSAISDETSVFKYPTIKTFRTENLLNGKVKCELVLSGSLDTETSYIILRSTDANFSSPSEVGKITISNGKTSGSFEDTVSDREKGIVRYYYRAKPEKFGVWEPQFFTTTDIYFNTSYLFPESFRFQNVENKSIKVSWDAVTDGIWENDFSYKLTMTGASGSVSVDSKEKGTTSLSIDQLIFCEPLTFEIAVVKGSGGMASIIKKHTFEKIVLQNADATPSIEYFKASKGVTADAVKLEWKVKEDGNANMFKRFILTRKPLSEGNSAGQSEVVARFDYEAGSYLYTYRDPDPDPGIYYEYSIAGQVECDGEVSTVATSIISSVGFKQPYGVVSGRVSFKDGTTAVSGVSILVEGTSTIQNRAMEFKQEANTQVRIPYNSMLVPRNGFTFQTWVKFKDFETTTSSNQTIVFANNLYALDFNNANKQYRLHVMQGAYAQRRTYTVVYDTNKFNSNEFDFNNFHQVTLTNHFNTQKAVLYINGEEVGSVNITDGYYMPDTDPEGIYFNLGRWRDNASILNGYMDEVRFWNYTLSKEEVERNYDRYLSGKEYGLVAYYRFDEFFGEDVYDYSGSGSNFNENHAKIQGSATRNQTEIPSANQLSIKGVTDEHGNYQITTIPYRKDGTDYKLTPILGEHSFSPSLKSLFFSPQSTVHNNIDFIDNSSFKITGKVYYDGGDYPVEGCHFLVDGKTVTDMYGSPILSEADGSYVISVPIGQHEIKVEKSGHTFVNEGKVLENGMNPVISGERNFNFRDLTRVKVVGRVTGGKVEHGKPLGFGESKNNIGAQTLILSARKDQYKLTTNTVDTTFQHNNGEWKKSSGRQQDESRLKITGSDITITVSNVTGEFMVDLYPEAYLIERVNYGKNNNDLLDGIMEELDLTLAAVSDRDMMQKSVRTWVDSIKVDATPNQPEYMKPVESSDTLYYHKSWTYFQQAYPTFSVQQLEGAKTIAAWGDKTYTRANPITGNKMEMDLYTEANGKVNYQFDMPVFLQGGTYKFKFKAFEEYVNDLSAEVEVDRVDVTSGEVRVLNNMELTYKSATVQLDSIGEATYSFYVGSPDLTTGMKTFEAVLYIDNIPYYWNREESTLTAFVLGAKSTGVDFVTAGPDNITAVLHDPPGSNSYSYLEKGTSFTKATTYSFVGGQSAEASIVTKLGTKLTTWSGVGAGVSQENEVTNESDIGVTETTTYKYADQTETVTTYTERFQTSADPLYVGHSGDVFVGNSTNIQYGETNSITILHKDELAEATNGSLYEPLGNTDYVIGKSKGLAFGLKFDTRFAYTEMEIKETYIPKWKNLIRSMLQVAEPKQEDLTTPYYWSQLDAEDENFGKSNKDEEAFGEEAKKSDYKNGPSYRIVFPIGYEESEAMDEFCDSIQYYHDQINMWESVLAENERNKVNMELLGNYSFGGGSQIEYSTFESGTHTTSHDFSFVLSPKVAGKAGGEFAGLGITFRMSTTVSVGTEDSWSSSETETKTIGFVLDDNGLTDQISVDYGKTEAGMIAFKSRGGRTSCPYEPEVRTEYYEPGVHVLSEATMQVDVPVLTVKGGSTRLRVPSHRPASFVLELKNESEIDWDNYYVLLMDDTTNPYGAVVKIDGTPIGNGRTVFLPAGEVTEKTITIEKGPDQNLYENIRIKLAAECQQLSLFDDVLLSVEFLPSCSDISFKLPNENWVVNSVTGDTLDIILEGYDVNYNNFTYVELEYKELSSANWIKLQKFYLDSVAGYDPDKHILLAETDTDIRYRWKMSQLPDGKYELRARTVCESNGVLLSEMISPALPGVKDMVLLQLFGKPQPANGILTGANDLMIRFNKEINEGRVTNSNFTITGVKNGTKDNHFTSVHFDGVSNYVTMEQEINLANKSFTVEFWLKRDQLGRATLFTHGTQSEAFTIGFTDNNLLQVQVGNSTITSTEPIANTSEWGHYAIVYEYTNSKVTAYYAAGNTNKVLIDNAAVKYNGMGIIKLGATLSNTNYLTGNMHGLRLWDRALTQSKVNVNRNIRLAGNELGLIGYWLMDEGKGTLLQDKTANRHGIMNASWKILPEGRALSFNGQNSYLTINTGGSVVVDNDEDFTIEMWFKGTSDSGTLFSSGRGDGNDSSTRGKLSIYIENGALKIASNGYVHTITSTNYLDNKWHHFALSVSRAGSANIYMDGELQSYMDGLEIGALMNSEMHLGMRRWNENNSDLPFNGTIDEVRIWSLALTQDYIDRYNNVRLLGNETGLIAYYPFDTYIVNDNDNKELKFSLADQVKDINTPDAIATNASEVSEIAPVKDAGPVEDYQFSFVTNKDQIILNLTEANEKIERTYITITADGIQDLNGNKMKSPVVWNAYIDRSFLYWEHSQLNKSKKNGEPLSFEVKIIKNGGYEENYTIENIPSWLTITPNSGTIQPSTTQTLIFTVDAGLNPGIYEEQIHLKGEYTQTLLLTLNVGGEKPDWSVDPNKYETSMSVIGQLKINDVISKDENDLVAAFIDGECVGVTSPVYNSGYDIWQVMLNIYCSENNKSIEFRIWDASTGKTYAKVQPVDVSFVPNKLLGSVLNPVIFATSNNMLQAINLKTGWNWISFNTVSDVYNDMNKLFVGIKNGVEFKGQDAGSFSRYDNELGGWLNSDLNGNGIDRTQMYLVKMEGNNQLQIAGVPMNPSQTSISLKAGWNWISFIPQFNMQVGEAFSGFTPNEGDIVKSMTEFAVYDAKLGWVGSLSYMMPNVGYMYKAASPKTFTYPERTSLSTKSSFEWDMPATEEYLGMASPYEHNLSMIAAVDYGLELPESAQLITRINGVVSNITPLTRVEDEQLFFTTIPGENGEDVISFSVQVYNEEIPLREKLSFERNTLVGSLENPKQLTLLGSKTLVYPNPFNTILSVEVENNDGNTIELNMYNLTGVLVYQSTHNATVGMNYIQLEERTLSSLIEGVYILQVRTGNRVESFKLIKNK